MMTFAQAKFTPMSIAPSTIASVIITLATVLLAAIAPLTFALCMATIAATTNEHSLNDICSLLPEQFLAEQLALGEHLSSE